MRHSPHVDGMAVSPASLVVNNAGIEVLETVSSTNENLITLAKRRCPHHYRLLTPDEHPDFTSQRLIATDCLKLRSSRLYQQVRALPVAIEIFL